MMFPSFPVSPSSPASPGSPALTSKPTEPIQAGGRWQGGKGKYPRHYEVGMAALIEVGTINGWHIRRCDIARVLIVDPAGDGVARPHEHEEPPPPQQHPPVDAAPRQPFVLLFAPRQYRMVVALLLHVGKPMPNASLFAEGTYRPERDHLLRAKVVKPVRKKLALLGLSLLHLLDYGYLVQVVSVAEGAQTEGTETSERSPVISSPASAPPEGEDTPACSTCC